MSGTLPHHQSSTPSHAMPDSEGTVEAYWNGKVDDHAIEHLLEWLEERLTTLNTPKLQHKRIIRVAVELLQNLHHHACGDSSLTYFRALKQGVLWTLQTQNEISNTQSTILQERMNLLTAMSTDRIRTEQLDLLSSGNRSNHGGGGVGLHEIIRKSNGQVEWLTQPTVDSREIAIFSVQLTPQS